MQHVEMLFRFIGGLGMFLYGMNVMADGLQKSAGNKMKHLLEFLTRNRLMGILVGAGVTASFRAARHHSYGRRFCKRRAHEPDPGSRRHHGRQYRYHGDSLAGVHERMGGILKPEFFAPLLIGIGAFMMLFSKRKKIVDVSEILVGFGVLFIGLNFMSGAITLTGRADFL